MNNQYAEGINRATLVFPKKGGKVVLATKTKKVCRGFLSGYGGKVEEGEGIHECAMREFEEETGGATIYSHHLTCHGVLHVRNFDAQGNVIYLCDVYVYVVETWYGNIVSTEEMDKPSEYYIMDLHQLNIMVHDKVWMPEILERRKYVHVYLDFEADGKTLRDLVRFDFISQSRTHLY